MYLKYTSSILQAYFNLWNYRRRRSILQVYVISTKEVHLKHFVTVNQYFNVNLKYTLSILKVYFLEVYYMYTLSILPLYFRSILQVYFTKKSWSLYGVHLSQWSTLWIELVVCSLQSHSEGLLLTTKSPGIFDTH